MNNDFLWIGIQGVGEFGQYDIANKKFTITGDPEKLLAAGILTTKEPNNNINQNDAHHAHDVHDAPFHDSKITDSKITDSEHIKIESQELIHC